MIEKSPKIIQNTLKHLDDDEFISRNKKSSNSFIRNRLLSFKTLSLFLMNLLKNSLQDELDSFFKNYKNLEFEKIIVSKAALCKARKNLSYSTFVELNKYLVDSFYKEINYKKWKGFRLSAIDGSTLKLPNNISTIEHFGRQTGKEIAQSRISSRYDVLNGVVIDLIVGSIHADERKMAHEHLKGVDSCDLLIYDRGYPCFSLFSAHRACSSNFVMRLPMKFSQETTAFEASGLMEKIITLSPRRPETRKRCIESGTSIEPMKIRLIKVPLGDGNIEILATSLLDKTTYPYDDFKSLYALRWAVEEDYKTKKIWMEYENFSGKSVESIYQDIYAKLFVQNIAGLIIFSAKPLVAVKYKGRELNYKINKVQALSKMKHCIFRLTTKKLSSTLKSLIDIFVLTVEPARPDRSFARNKKFRQRHIYPQYKTIR